MHCIRLPKSNKQRYDGHSITICSEVKKKTFNGEHEFQTSTKPMNGVESYNEVQYVINN